MSTDWPDGYGKRVLAEVDSTLNEAARIAPTLSGPEWILAHRQTAARGRRGRRWTNTSGNLAATLVMFPKDPAATAALRSFVTALALFDACVAVSGRSDGFALKWPNDVLLNGGKLAGILLESAGQAGSMIHLSIGVGVNLIDAPAGDAVEAGAVRPVSLLSETGAQVDPETFLTHLAAAYARYETQFTTYGFAPIRAAWLARAARLGEVITARTVTTETTGTFETVDGQGSLVLNTARGRVGIAAADVFF
ncbi:biotin--[acetyl-CoA-carboxylase] ligase [Sedimentitalea nanhaiensis]|uniref:biotin--[biotin carboxyl-carrier protein] ligase n=1 Tax=Sedimentitalea nanhaiensis TaxID=999627 RepID=A0A1I6ZL23_9RHOB|nr:biotin--[acetyl-CoA-carboxylase] ligase [Sedimentitalea nanhaiensis]SFT63315.1 BirA family transcriptional regulator, biotin operon repressor / biotin-[acetyl-CoA-carboxylase] ligase [Sedimentitalea nanhaiensis]